MEIDQLPDFIDVMLSENEAIAFPHEGEIIKTQQVRMYCFNAKQYVSTWPLRARIMECNAKIASQFASFAPSGANNPENQLSDASTMTGLQFKQLMLMGGFDLISGLQEFKNIVIAGKLCELDDDVFMNKERWEQVQGTAQEKMFFDYCAAFIVPCVL